MPRTTVAHFDEDELLGIEHDEVDLACGASVIPRDRYQALSPEVTFGTPLRSSATGEMRCQPETAHE